MPVGELKDLNIVKKNTVVDLSGHIKKNSIIGENYQCLLKKAIPRPNKLIREKELIRLRTPWDFKVSLFTAYANDCNAELEKKCFEFDWETMKQLKYKKSSLEEVKETLRKGYRMIREAYRY